MFPVDNVHFQQAAKLNTALVDEQVDFEAMVGILLLLEPSEFQRVRSVLARDSVGLRAVRAANLAAWPSRFVDVRARRARPTLKGIRHRTLLLFILSYQFTVCPQIETTSIASSPVKMNGLSLKIKKRNSLEKKKRSGIGHPYPKIFYRFIFYMYVSFSGLHYICAAVSIE